jgi:hypothetical protein
MRQFELHRKIDVSGVSGVGVVAVGMQFGKALDIIWPDGVHTQLPAGWVRLDWHTAVSSTGLYGSAEEVVALHGHGGATSLVWLDDEPVTVESLSRPWSEAFDAHDRVTGRRAEDPEVGS